MKSDLVGYIANLHLRIADVKGFDCTDCLELAEAASHAVDFPKRGTAVSISKLPRAPDELKPDFMAGEVERIDVRHPESRYYPSIKILGKLYRNIPDEELFYENFTTQTIEYERISSVLFQLKVQDLDMDFLLQEPGEDLMTEMVYVLEEFCDRLFAIAHRQTISRRLDEYLTEAEILTGTIQEGYLDHRKRKDAVAEMNIEVCCVSHSSTVWC
jgi:RNA-dependent RNA polymerase